MWAGSRCARISLRIRWSSPLRKSNLLTYPIATLTGVSAADIIQLVIAFATGGAAVAAWVAALTSRSSARDTRDSARETAIGQLIAVHTQGVAALAQLHSKLSWVTEGGGPRNTLMWAERAALMMGMPLGTLTVQGIELRGMVEATGLDLSITRQVADAMIRRQNKGVPIDKADIEVRDAIKAENDAIASLESQIPNGPAH